MQEGPRFSAAWAVGAAIVVVVAIVIGAGLFVFSSLRSIPQEVVGSGLEVAEKVREKLAELLGRRIS